MGWWSLEELIIPDPLLRFVSDENRRPGNLKTLIASCFKAWDTMNPENAAQFYAKDPELVFFDLGHLKFEGSSEFSEGAKKTFDSMLSRNLEMRDDFRATRRGNVAWLTVSFRLSGRLKNGKRLGTDGRIHGDSREDWRQVVDRSRPLVRAPLIVCNSRTVAKWRCREPHRKRTKRHTRRSAPRCVASCREDLITRSVGLFDLLLGFPAQLFQLQDLVLKLLLPRFQLGDSL